MKIYTVKIDTDYSALGEDGTQEMLDGYAQNLAAHLASAFCVDVEVEQSLGGRGECIGPDDAIAERIQDAVNDIQSSDGWVNLLPPAGTCVPGPMGGWDAIDTMHLLETGEERAKEDRREEPAEEELKTFRKFLVGMYRRLNLIVNVLTPEPLYSDIRSEINRVDEEIKRIDQRLKTGLRG